MRTQFGQVIKLDTILTWWWHETKSDRFTRFILRWQECQYWISRPTTTGLVVEIFQSGHNSLTNGPELTSELKRNFELSHLWKSLVERREKPQNSTEMFYLYTPVSNNTMYVWYIPVSCAAQTTQSKLMTAICSVHPFVFEDTGVRAYACARMLLHCSSQIQMQLGGSPPAHTPWAKEKRKNLCSNRPFLQRTVQSSEAASLCGANFCKKTMDKFESQSICMCNQICEGVKESPDVSWDLWMCIWIC